MNIKKKFDAAILYEGQKILRLSSKVNFELLFIKSFEHLDYAQKFISGSNCLVYRDYDDNYYHLFFEPQRMYFWVVSNSFTKDY